MSEILTSDHVKRIAIAYFDCHKVIYLGVVFKCYFVDFNGISDGTILSR